MRNWAGKLTARNSCATKLKRGRSGAALLQREAKGLGAEEDGFALEHFDGEEEREGGVNAG
jgi:hypothetical protein